MLEHEFNCTFLLQNIYMIKVKSRSANIFIFQKSEIEVWKSRANKIEGFVFEVDVTPDS